MSHDDTKKVRTTVALDLDDYAYLKHFAKSKGLSFADLSRLALKEWIYTRKRSKPEA
jgi:hypothetical protein